MSDKYKIWEPDRAYFVTMTVEDWVDVFTRKCYKLRLLDSLRFCQRMKGLEIYAWCLMSNHLHMIVKAAGKPTLSEILRDFKKFTSRELVADIGSLPESRRDWMLARFRHRGKNLRRVSDSKFWQDGNHAEILLTPHRFYQKLKYIHNNPVVAMIVEKPEDYLFSSARNYAGLSSLLEIVMETPELMTVK